MSITMSEPAALEVKRLIEGRAMTEKLYLRMAVAGGGGSGFSHKLELDTQTDPLMDSVFESHGVSIVVDRTSLTYLDGSTVDFHDDLNRRGFKIDNPNAKSTCGCGSSFSV